MNSIKITMAAIALAVTGATTSSCYIRISDEAREKIKSEIGRRRTFSEVVYSESEPAVFHPGEFDSLEVSDWMDVTFIQREGAPEVLVSGTHRSRDEVRVENEAGTLKIFFNKNEGGVIVANNENVTVYAPGISVLNKKGSGDIHFEKTFSGKALTIDASGSGDVIMDECEITGPVTINKTGSGDVIATIRGNVVSVTADGSGDVRLEGSAKELILDKSGSGSFYSGNMETQKVTVTRVSGSGEVAYKENGKVKSATK